MLKSIESFRDQWLKDFFLYGKATGHIPKAIETSLARKLDILNAATIVNDLRSPPGNRYENLQPPLKGYSAVRINEKYRLIFIWKDGKATDVYLDPHSYKNKNNNHQL
ncbi:type II toxin-antitoxin system RelE/ParE family toxin [Kosakonia radicincitans]|uniref:type II toxin-antitoxin system RelE/ParE family toxin n=1 Tax=Kosakonia radicincitans TaxID=283686 RepID=UPI001D07FAB9|nr:type II toxin-antitoxin system RelE/ParE family toxin [Kosakonia radicincitans]